MDRAVAVRKPRGTCVIPPCGSRLLASTAFPQGSIDWERPREGVGQRVKTHSAPRPHQALGLGGRSRPGRCRP